METHTLAIQTQDLGRIYKIRDAKKKEARELAALTDVNLQVRQGELFGLLGPNGAGKTTLIKILTTLLAPSKGSAQVAGFDVIDQTEQVRPRINMVSGGESSGYGLLTVRENLWMFAQFYGIPSKLAHERITQLLDVVGLSDRQNTKSSDLSTGLRQKMNIVRGFLTDPEVLFLDEPTLGLDVGASRDVRMFVRSWMNERPSRTVLLTTHYMAEADDLCDRVAIINHGRVLACDQPARLKHALQSESIFRIEVSPMEASGVEALQRVPGVQKAILAEQNGHSTLELMLEQESALGGVISQLSGANVQILNFQKREPTLEDVFVTLVGKSMAEVEHGSIGAH
jgi:ABC-2 type transport system ATP-binding protein